ncbi:MAG: hypothetical protein IPP30_07630 [Flavobacterium sp.]|nr:hypothetical protein [Flavobacterium sp.]
MKKSIVVIVFAMVFNHGYTQSFSIKESGTFIPQKKKVILYQDKANKNLILFKTNLQVNTDGIPISYHPFDLRGNSIALNTILNAVSIYRLSDKIRISNPKSLTRSQKMKKKNEIRSIQSF